MIEELVQVRKLFKKRGVQIVLSIVVIHLEKTAAIVNWKSN